jgi:hypothetical protein
VKARARNLALVGTAATITLAGAVMLGSGSSFAQASNPPALQHPDSRAPQSPDPALPSTGETLSERLNRSDGVIAPPEGVAPDMRVTPRDPGAGSSMPVIPPPGSPGGDRSVAPK